MDIPNNWTFKDVSVAEAFDAHVREQLPWYEMVTRAVSHLITTYLPERGVLVDFGASTGNIARSVQDVLVDRGALVVPIEPSAEMCDMYRGPGLDNLHRCAAEDFCWRDDTGIPIKADVCTFMLTLMFIPPGMRENVLRDAVANTMSGGAVIIVDRCQNSGTEFGNAMWRLTLLEKLHAGADPGKIVEKELSLRGVQRPLAPGWIESTFGGKEFFRFGDFAGWVVEVK